jgi:hypothetical protein
MSKKLAMLLSAGALSFALVGCDLFGGDDDDTTTTPDNKDTALVKESAELTLGGSGNATIGSYLDVDGDKVYSSKDLEDPTKAKLIDLQFAPNGTTAEFFTPAASSKQELKDHGNQTLKVAPLSMEAIAFLMQQDTTKQMQQWQLDSIWSLSSSKAETKIEVAEGDMFLMKSSEGVATMIEVVQADTENGKENVSIVIVGQK